MGHCIPPRFPRIRNIILHGDFTLLMKTFPLIIPYNSTNKFKSSIESQFISPLGLARGNKSRNYAFILKVCGGKLKEKIVSFSLFASLAR